MPSIPDLQPPLLPSDFDLCCISNSASRMSPSSFVRRDLKFKLFYRAIISKQEAKKPILLQVAKSEKPKRIKRSCFSFEKSFMELNPSIPPPKIGLLNE